MLFTPNVFASNVDNDSVVTEEDMQFVRDNLEFFDARATSPMGADMNEAIELERATIIIDKNLTDTLATRDLYLVYYFDNESMEYELGVQKGNESNNPTLTKISLKNQDSVLGSFYSTDDVSVKGESLNVSGAIINRVARRRKGCIR